MADITTDYNEPNFDSYAQQMKEVEQLVEKKSRHDILASKHQYQNRVMGEVDKFSQIATRPRTTAAEVMAGRVPQQQSRPTGGQQLGTVGSAQSTLGTYDGVGQTRKIMAEYMKEKGKTHKVKRKTRLDDEAKLREIYKAFEYESRGTSHLKKLSSDVMRIDKALKSLGDFISGKRILTEQDAADLSAAATALGVGSIPPERLIDKTTYRTVHGKIKALAQQISGKPQEYYTKELMLNLREQFKAFDIVIKHALSNHATSVFNRANYLFNRNPDFKKAVLTRYGHRLGFIDPETHLATPRLSKAPFLSVDNMDFSDSEALHNIRYGKDTSIDKPKDPFDIMYENILNVRRKRKKQRETEEELKGKGLIKKTQEWIGDERDFSDVASHISDKASAAAKRFGQSLVNTLNSTAGTIEPKQDPISKDPISKDSISKDPISKDSISKDPISKDSISKDPISKDSSLEELIAKDKQLSKQLNKRLGGR